MLRLFKDQEQAVELAFKNPVCVLTGAPGTGKTTVVKTIIDQHRQKGLKAALAAPTGKAAKRLSEATGYSATTIHRLLVPVPVPGGGFAFSHNSDNPVDTDFIAIDESSMVDIPLMSALLEAIKQGTKLLIVGDHYQLPAVGAGNVLKDIIGSKKIPSFELEKIKRQDPGFIITNCHHIKNGENIEINNAQSKDFFFIEENSESGIKNTILELISKRLPGAYNIDPLKDIQTLSPLNEKTELSCKSLNMAIEERLNKNPVIEKCRFRVGTKVIQCKNDYKNEIVNGDMGVVKDINTKEQAITVEIEGRREVTLPLYENDLAPAYAITIHKSQGSEWPIVIIPIHKCFGTMIMQRNLLYTAISRGKKIVILVGQRTELPKIIARNQQARRFTNLERFLN